MKASPLPPISDLTTCDREPIHTPGAIQPYGVLFALDPDTLTVRSVSENTLEFLGRQPASLLGQTLPSFVRTDCRETIDRCLRVRDVADHNPLKLAFAGNDDKFDAFAHHHQGNLFVEVERPSTGMPGMNFHDRLRRAMTRLRQSTDLIDLCRRATDEVRSICGFDRVVVYRFERDWSGLVVGESLAADTGSYLGLRFPATDIPKQARELYRLNPIRVVPTIHYTPARLLSASESTEPLDLSLSLLRAVSPVHLEYLGNMGVSASMSISLMRGNALWGLISCTHEHGPLFPTYETRTACEFIGNLVSSLIDPKQKEEDAGYRIKLKSSQAVLLQLMSHEKDFVRGLLSHEPNLMDVTGATGAAVFYDDEFSVIGRAPEDADLERLVKWLASRRDEEVFVTESLPSIFPESASFKDTACGVVAASLSRGQNNYVLWFRPEVIQTVDWGGNPDKRIEADTMRIHPRKSFEAWKQTVSLQCLPWKEVELEAARELRTSLIDIVLQKGEELSKLNIELARSNEELDAFAYAASHDLKEPLRGIHNYARLTMRALGDTLDGENLERMQTVVRLTQRMERLIDSLLHYAQVGRMNLTMRPTDLNEVVKHALETLKIRLDESKVSIRIPRPLPVVNGDRVRLEEVFTNLISNALKYNDKAEKWVEIGWDGGAPGKAPTLYVKDNGIGIRERNFEKAFRIFKRLHARDKFGGGAGTGLTITKRIIERHHGRIRIESEVGSGSTFSFTLQEEGPREFSP